MPKSNVSKQMVLNFLCRNQSVSQPVQLYLALYATNPTDADVGSEASYEGYQRQAITFGPPTLSGGAAMIQNSAAVQFGVVPSSAGTIGFAALRTAATGGDLVYYGSLAATYQLNQGVQPIVPIGALTVSET